LLKKRPHVVPPVVVAAKNYVMEFKQITALNYAEVATIYQAGIATGMATFQLQATTWADWDKSHTTHSRLALYSNNCMVGWAALSPVSSRCVYGGVAEVSVYIAADQRGKGWGKILLDKLIEESEKNNIWTLQSGIFENNKASIILHQKCGFRIIGYREKIGQLHGVWKNNILLEKRSKKIGISNKNILVLCTGNSCRSQIAEGYLKYFCGTAATIYSAGIETHGVNPKAIATMLQDGIDISLHTSNNIAEYANISFDYVITVCNNAKEKCPYFPATVKILHHNFDDPAKATGTDIEIMHQFATVRDAIKIYCKDFVATYITV
jgi:thioredoxin type arsenate reductase